MTSGDSRITVSDLHLEDAWEIVRVFEKALEEKVRPILDVDALPLGKELIREAILTALLNTEDLGSRSSLVMDFLSLADFQSLSASEQEVERLRFEESERLLATAREIERGGGNAPH